MDDSYFLKCSAIVQVAAPSFFPVGVSLSRCLASTQRLPLAKGNLYGAHVFTHKTLEKIMTNSNKLPMWLVVLTAFLFISNLFVFGGAALFNPDLAFPNAGQGAVFPIQFFAVRHIAFAFPLLYGLIRQDRKVLIVMYSIFLVMSGIDIILLGIYGYNIPILGLIPAIGALGVAGKVLVGILGLFTPVGIGLWQLVAGAE